MATISAVFAAHATLSSSTVDTVTLTGAAMGRGFASSIEVSNETPANGSGAANIYFKVGTSTTTSPTVAGNDTYVVLPGQAVQVSTGSGSVVKLISSGTPAYSVTGVSA